MSTPPPTVRKLVVEVIDARDLLPKDGQGTSSPYVVVEFDGQRKRTRTQPRDLNPQWNERLEFIVSDPSVMEAEELDVEVYNDKRMGSNAGGARKNHFLGRVKIYGSQFARRGEEGLIYFPLEKRSLLSWIRGEIGMKIYYYDEQAEEKKPDAPPPEEKQGPLPPPPSDLPIENPTPTEAAVETQAQAPPPVCVVVVEEAPLPPPAAVAPQPEDTPPVQYQYHHHHHPPPPAEAYPPEVRKIQTSSEKLTRSSSGRSARVISGRFTTTAGEPVDRVQTAYDLVEPMQYLFVRIVKARNIRPAENPYVKIRSGTHTMRSRPARDGSGNPEWNQVFALNQTKPESTLEISTWDGGPTTESFLGGVCFDLSDVPVRDQPDGLLAPQWYRLEGSGDTGDVTGDVMVAVWFGTQSDESFPESMTSDAPYVSYTRSKVYQSPKLWYLRASVIEAQDVHVAPLPPGAPVDIRVKIQVGFQSARTRRAAVTSSNSTFSWFEDLMFVAAEPLDEQLVLLVEDRSVKEPALVGHVMVAVNSVEQRLDERQLIASKWFNLEGGGGGGGPGGNESYTGRIHLRLCLEGGYHVLDEAAHVCSDFRPTAKQLWKPPVGVLELGILGARGLLPMKTKSGAKGSTDAYCVVKYGKKWVRTRTITDSFDPRWNEQYTWQVYDPCTVMTIGVFDNWRMFADQAAGEDRPDYRIGKVRPKP